MGKLHRAKFNGPYNQRTKHLKGIKMNQGMPAPQEPVTLTRKQQRSNLIQFLGQFAANCPALPDHVTATWSNEVYDEVRNFLEEKLAEVLATKE